ncbi:MAG TPA: molybdopterin-dependent oxidoreductase, partial [Vicinamibacterales bacterium]|nr:molybdopterin-dependent oxidoreductase [Vicinamibacterales bacterium]
MPRRLAPASWGRSTIPTACPLDCPDSCSLQVTVENGRILKIDGGDANPATRDFICAKVRRFTGRVYGEDRLLYPAIRKGPKGQGLFTRVSWDEALDHIAERMMRIRDSSGAEAILPFSYGGSNGLLTQDTTDATLFRAFGTSRLARTVCAAPTGAANQALYGKMAGVTYRDYVHARLIILWGVNPSASGIHLVPFLKEARQAGATLVVIDPRSTSLARQADMHLSPHPGTDLPLALAIHNYLFERGLADAQFLAEHARGVDELATRAADWPIPRAAQVAGVEAADLERLAGLYASTSPALVRCGWGLERNRNGGSAAAAVLALPAVAGKFKVRGGGFSMSNSTAWGIKAAMWADTPEPATRIVNMNHLGRALLDYTDPPVQMLFVYNCNPLVTMPDQNRVLRGLEREDLFTVVYEQVFTDTCRFADVLLPATTFLENYDIAKGYGPISLQLVRPVIEPVGEARPNPEVFSALAGRLGIASAEEETDTLLRVVSRMPGAVGSELVEHGTATPAHDGAPVQFVDVFPLTPDQKVDLYPEALATQAPAGLYGYQPDPATDRHPLALISPASEKTISSTLGELRERAGVLQMHP